MPASRAGQQAEPIRVLLIAEAAPDVDLDSTLDYDAYLRHVPEVVREPVEIRATGLAAGSLPLGDVAGTVLHPHVDCFSSAIERHRLLESADFPWTLA